jgi:dihydroneopterin aldolase
MTDRILVHALVFYGYHGVGDDERAVGGRYRVDLTLERDLAAAGASDQLADTLSYADVARAAVLLGTTRRFRLLEALAAALADMVLAEFDVDAVTVCVTKEHPPVPEIIVGAAAVEITRRRVA